MRSTRRLVACLLSCLAAVMSPLGTASRIDAAAQDTTRIACVGDSITEGNANADFTRNSWPRILERLLEKVEPDAFKVGNFGRSGATALRAGSKPYWNEGVFEEARAFAPDIVVINLGTNDAAPRNWREHGAAFEQDYGDLIRTFAELEPAPSIRLSTLTPVHRQWLGEEYTAARATVEQAIRRLATRHGLDVIDLQTPLEHQPRLFPDGLHPNTAGNELMACAVLEAITGAESPRDESIRPRPLEGAATAIVDAGRASAVELGSWTQGDGWISGHGPQQRCTARLRIGPGDFHVRARLRMLEQENSAAGFFLDGDFLGFEGARGTLFRNGPHMRGLRLLHPSPEVFPRGTWIEFEAIRNGEQLWFLVNGDVVDMALYGGRIERFGFDPFRSTMQIESWSIAGDVEPRQPAHFERRTASCPWVDLDPQSERQRFVPGTVTGRPPPSERLELAGGVPVSLRGHGHVVVAADDGRKVIAFRDDAPTSPTFGDLVAWVGTQADLDDGREGAYTARLFRNPGPREALDDIRLSHAKDGAFVASAAFVGDSGRARVTVTFDMAALDALVPTPGYDIPIVDLDRDAGRHVLVDREPGQYLGHVTTTLLEDGRTILAVYPKGHGRGPIVYKRSEDGGRTWSPRLPTPENWATSLEVPTIHRTIDPRDGTKRHIVWSGLYPARRAVSQDDGATWSPLEVVGDWGGIVVMGFVERLADGRYLAMFHDDGRFFTGRNERVDPPVFTVYQTTSADGGLTWSKPSIVWSGAELHLCEPGCVRSPDGSTLAVLLRENSRRRNSFVIFSTDEGATWSPPRELPASLTGDRHTPKYAPDGRLFISFRDTARESPTQGDWVGWVGTWEDILLGTPGQYRVRVKDNKHRWDTTYPGVEVLPDGTFVVTTYGHWDEGEQPYILSARFTLAELDARVETDEGAGREERE